MVEQQELNPGPRPASALYPPAVVGSLRIYRPHISSGVGGSLHRYWGGGSVSGGGGSILFPLYAEVHLR
ncbi:unnamed protein product [Rangifer tarandus platyrhynchus]|uniref:Uncharacterized protein n=1 Tax=Rangifer tarandus platyrhynchus TaxID=3082113 RepID=A0AC59ZP07_RANTA